MTSQDFLVHLVCIVCSQPPADCPSRTWCCLAHDLGHNIWHLAPVATLATLTHYQEEVICLLCRKECSSLLLGDMQMHFSAGHSRTLSEQLRSEDRLIDAVYTNTQNRQCCPSGSFCCDGKCVDDGLEPLVSCPSRDESYCCPIEQWEDPRAILYHNPGDADYEDSGREGSFVDDMARS
jgi:hypothetical protein